MNTFGKRIRPAVDHELMQSRALEATGRTTEAFHALERAHVLGQASTVQHVRVHVLMLFWAWRQRRAREAVGQVFRVVGAATKTALGWAPAGNTGGSNVSPFRPLPVPDDLQQTLDRARSRATF